MAAAAANLEGGAAGYTEAAWARLERDAGWGGGGVRGVMRPTLRKRPCRVSRNS